MIKFKIKKINTYGIQNRFFKYVMIILAASFLLSSICIGVIVSKNTKQSVIDKYGYINEKIMLSKEIIGSIIDSFIEALPCYIKEKLSLSSCES